MKNKLYTLQDDLKLRLKNPEFKKEWEASKPEYELGRLLIEKRLAFKMSQRELAEKANTTQAAISRIESMNSNPSLDLLKRIAHALNSKLSIELK